MAIYVREELQEKGAHLRVSSDWLTNPSRFDRNTLTEDINEGSQDVFLVNPRAETIDQSTGLMKRTQRKACREPEKGWTSREFCGQSDLVEVLKRTIIPRGRQ